MFGDFGSCLDDFEWFWVIFGRASEKVMQEPSKSCEGRWLTVVGPEKRTVPDLVGPSCVTCLVLCLHLFSDPQKSPKKVPRELQNTSKMESKWRPFRDPWISWKLMPLSSEIMVFEVRGGPISMYFRNRFGISLGMHFGDHLDLILTSFLVILVTLGSILVIWEGPGSRLEFWWILAPPKNLPAAGGGATEEGGGRGRTP